MRHNLDDISRRYRRDVLVVESAYGFTLEDADGHGNIFDAELQGVAGYPATPEGQAAFLTDLAEAVAAVPAGRGRGVVYWEPAWVAVEGNGWDPTDPSSGNAWETRPCSTTGTGCCPRPPPWPPTPVAAVARSAVRADEPP
ncbi:glycosyl hydrolase 53 family protein [Nocardiopsis aegyptia]|uniref:glycosyl hydrolase 53 family protein n=1 Tax=Nocardiopsis aegyptia TaxID=220378 RepID=UPI00366B2C4C